MGRNKVLQGGIDFDKMAKKLDKVLLEYKYADVKVKIRSTRQGAGVKSEIKINIKVSAFCRRFLEVKMYTDYELYYANIIKWEDDDVMQIINSGYFLGEELNKYVKKGLFVEVW